MKMKRIKRKVVKGTNLDAVKAMRRGNREAEMERTLKAIIQQYMIRMSEDRLVFSKNNSE